MALSSMVSDALSIICITLSLFQKIPQISSVVKLKSAAGISLSSLLMEVTSYSITASYNYVNQYAILSYMEYPILIAQEYVLIYVVLAYQGLWNKKSIYITIGYFTVVICFMSGIIPAPVLTFLLPFCTPVSLSSKGIQLWAIIRTMNADSVSISTWVISAVTNGSRIYTIYMDSADAILLTNFTLSTILSSSIAISAHLLKKDPKKIN